MSVRAGSRSVLLTMRANASPAGAILFFAKTSDFDLVNANTGFEFSSATCPCGVHCSVSSFSITSSGSLCASETPVIRLNQRYIASRFSFVYP